ncbi:MAG: hypothetical protein K0R54_1818 [Clostridiaceae bacterium]|jgi:hypothetical protein|nr:hypothetical protein [Clostridiaceae bacterium]
MKNKKIDLKIAKDEDGLYYANIYIEKICVKTPEYEHFRTLKKFIKDNYNIKILPLKELSFEKFGGTLYLNIKNIPYIIKPKKMIL